MCMEDFTGRETGIGDHLVAEQLELLETIKNKVRLLLARGESVEEPLVDDIMGIVLVLRAALLADEALHPGREKLDVSEREARQLLRVALRHRYERKL